MAAPLAPPGSVQEACPISCCAARTGTAHLVIDEAMAAGRRAGGRYSAVCGIEVLPASLTAPERRSCPGCVAGSSGWEGVAVVDVFVSHAGRDRPWAEWVAWQSDRAGLSVELDYRGVGLLSAVVRIMKGRCMSSPDRFGTFSRSVSYSGWKRLLYAVGWFDSRPERDVANALDDCQQCEPAE